MPSPAQKVILITGATDGLGKATALELARRGAVLLLHGRNPGKGNKLLQEIIRAGKHNGHRYYNADFVSLVAVNEMAENILSENDRLDMLINNAGLGSGQKNERRQESDEGHELKFAVNYLAHFLLTLRLLPLLRRHTPAKIINVASAAQKEIDFEDVMLKKNYTGRRAYAQSKLALVMFTFDLAAALKDTGITANCLHPASLMDTNMVRQSDEQVLTTVDEGVDTLLYVSLSSEVENVTGAYFDHHKQSMAKEQAYDAAARRTLKELSLRLTRERIGDLSLEGMA